MSIYLNEKNRVKNPLAYYQQKIPNPKNLTGFRNVDKMISLEGDMIVKVDRTSNAGIYGMQGSVSDQRDLELHPEPSR